MLTRKPHRRTYIAPVILCALAFPAAALAAGGDGDPGQAGLADAKPAAPNPLHGPVVSFHRAIDAAVERRQAEVRRARREQRERFAALPGGVSIATLESIAACESGGDPTAVSSDGTYRGKYQFHPGTWESVGGSGDPAAAPEAEQDYRAALLYASSGSSPWPICG
ncbi:MAG TPA: transglycosylase family protein [Solirubrobacterales bacterium]|nr:transglycosylase family protein [Solirubrobacterales bacterium]